MCIDFIYPGCGKKTCGNRWTPCTEMIEGTSVSYCTNCKDYCNNCEEPCEKGSEYDCDHCGNKICSDCVKANEFRGCHKCEITLCDRCVCELPWQPDEIPSFLPGFRDCCEKSICRECAPSTECEVCANEYCTEEGDCRRWHLKVCTNAKRGKVEK